jgi:hypothetical protein
VPIPKIIPFVEGQGDVQALPILVKRVLVNILGAQFSANPVDICDAWRVGHLNKLQASGCAQWIRLLGVAGRNGASAVLLVLDGDNLGKLCPVEVARALSKSAQVSGAAVGFSVGVVFAMQEMESWFIADAQALSLSLNTQPLRRVKPLTAIPDNPEHGPRDAKGWLSHNMPDGYKPTIHQAEFARRLDIHTVRSQNLRSFRRFEHAVQQLYTAVVSGSHVATP